VSASISSLIQSIDKDSPIQNPDIKRLIVSLTKTGTIRSMSR
jgi:hypothetical protein